MIEFDANGRDCNGYKQCTSCGHPHKPEACDNPACYANPSISEERKAVWRAETKRRDVEEAERERIRKIRRRMIRRS